MSENRSIVNTNLRLDLRREADRQAWQYLQSLDRTHYKSYSKAIVAAVNDYFGRQSQRIADPYLETRQKEDAFLEKVLSAVREGVQSAASAPAAQSLVQLLRAATTMPDIADKSSPTPFETPDAPETEEFAEDALAFVDSF